MARWICYACKRPKWHEAESDEEANKQWAAHYIRYHTTHGKNHG